METLSEFFQALLSKPTTGKQTLSLFIHTRNTDCILLKEKRESPVSLPSRGKYY